jgi:hypothetical protein
VRADGLNHVACDLGLHAVRIDDLPAIMHDVNSCDAYMSRRSIDVDLRWPSHQ